MRASVKKSKKVGRNKDRVNLILKVNRGYLKLYFWTKWNMTRRGKKDGKRSIPYIDMNGKWVSPTIQEEFSKVNNCISEAYQILCKNNARCFLEFERCIAEFKQKALEIQRLHSFLEEKLNPFDVIACATGTNTQMTKEQINMLDSKRNSENNAEVMGIRIRRFNEYQKPYEPLRTRLIIARKELEDTYKNIIYYYGQIDLINTRLRVFYTELCSAADVRISWYWQGVLKKHTNKRNMHLQIPKTEDDTFNRIYALNIDGRTKEIDEVRKIRDKILSLSIV